MNEYRIKIGLEVHCELNTATKLLCGCENAFGGQPNTRCCPICMGYPGAMPILSEQAITLAMTAALALDCTPSKRVEWDRKNYFYPDLPKAWQITQYRCPIAGGGEMQYECGGESKRLRISRIQLEEDAGKLIHDGQNTFVDFNRCGVPLVEIVTMPDLASPEEAECALRHMKSALEYAGVSDVKMQEGSLRCDVNVSVSPLGAESERTEGKNLNSFKAVRRFCAFEIDRQKKLLENGERVQRITLRWDDLSGVATAMRGKESVRDYKYIAEPDIPPVEIDDARIESIKNSMPPSLEDYISLFTKEYALPRYDAEVLTSAHSIATLLVDAVKCGAQPKTASNFIMSNVMRLAKKSGREDYDTAIDGQCVARLLNLIDDGKITAAAAKERVLPAVMSGSTLDDAIAKYGAQPLTAEATEKVVREVITEQFTAVEEYKKGNKKAFSFLIGQVMKKCSGNCQPAVVNETLNKLLEGEQK